MSVFATFANRSIIKATRVMETALSVGARLSLEPTGSDLPVVKRPDGQPYIPGSSIKGVVRFQTERLLRTIARRPELWACDPLSDPCVPARDEEKGVNATTSREALMRKAEAESNASKRPADEIFAEAVFEHSCTACRLFGSPSFAGRVACKDAYLLNGDRLAYVTQVRDGVGIDRDLGAARSGIKYDFETVAPGSHFGIEMVAENLDDWELGLLLTVLNWWGEGGFAIGGKSTRGPGWGKLQGLTVQRVTRDNLLDYLSDGRAPSADISPYLQAFRNRLRGEAGNA